MRLQQTIPQSADGFSVAEPDPDASPAPVSAPAEPLPADTPRDWVDGLGVFGPGVEQQSHVEVSAGGEGAPVAVATLNETLGVFSQREVSAAQVPEPGSEEAEAAPELEPLPESPARFDRFIRGGIEHVYDQPRNADGRYAVDDPETPLSESSLRWRPVVAEDDAPLEAVASAEPVDGAPRRRRRS